MKLLGALIAIAGLVGCGGPYAGAPDRLPHGPKKTPPPPDTAGTGPVITYVDDCTAHFTDDPTKAKKSPSKAGPFVQGGDDAIGQAAAAKDPQMQLADVLQAIDQYKKKVDEGRIQQKDVDQRGYPRDLDELVEGVDVADPQGGLTHKMRFLHVIPTDPQFQQIAIAATAVIEKR